MAFDLRNFQNGGIHGDGDRTFNFFPQGPDEGNSGVPTSSARLTDRTTGSAVAGSAENSANARVAHDAESTIADLHDLQRSRGYKIVEDRPIKSQFIWNTVLQIAGLIAAFLFGVFSVLAFSAAQHANEESLVANQLAMLSFCEYNDFEICSRINELAASDVEILASSVFSFIPIAITTTSAPSSIMTSGSPPTTSSSSASSSVTISGSPPTTSTQIEISTSSIASITSQSPPSTATSIPSATPITTPRPSQSIQGARPHGLTTSDKIAIGVGLPVGVISLIGVFLSVFTWRAKNRLYRRPNDGQLYVED